MDPFDFLNSINQTKENLMQQESDEKDYTPFITNRSLSYFVDTILYANEINQYAQLPNRLQYEYLLNAIPKKKRFSKWAKKDSSDDIQAVSDYYGYNLVKSAEAIKIINKSDLNKIKLLLQKGGVKKQ